MSQYKLTYFDIAGGRGEPIRLAMHLGDIAFEDFRFPFSQFMEVRESTPLKQVPTLMIDGVQITQCNAILRYFGKLTDLYPKDAYQALLCDEVMDAIEDITDKVVATFGLEGDALKQARQALADGPLPQYLGWLQAKLAANGGAFFADNRLTIADLKLFVWSHFITSGQLDHIPTDLIDRHAPLLNQHRQSVAAIEKIKDYYAS